MSKLLHRSAARLAAVQALYQMEIAGTSLPDVLREYESHWIGHDADDQKNPEAQAAYFRDIVSGVLREQRTLDPLVDDVLARGWPLKRVEAVLRAVLRAGAYELTYKPEVPARAAVSEYVNVAGAFLDREETGMVNAVLDGLARKLRAAEFDRTG